MGYICATALRISDRCWSPQVSWPKYRRSREAHCPRDILDEKIVLGETVLLYLVVIFSHKNYI